MVFLIHLPQMLSADMRVYLGGGDLAVSEHELNRPEIRAPFQKMRSESVPEDVGAYFLLQTGQFAVFFQHFPEPLSSESPPSR